MEPQILKILNFMTLLIRVIIKLTQDLVTLNLYNIQNSRKMIRETSQIQKSNIWEQAAKQKTKLTQAASTLQKTFIVLGSNSSGKSSFIKVFKSDLDFQTKPTNLLEYTHIKKQSLAIKKQLINCYEIASKSLIEIVLSLVNKDNFEQVVFVLCVDLGKVGGNIQEVIQWMELIRREGDKIVNEKLINKREKYEQFKESANKSIEGHEDQGNIQPMPFHTIIVGTKYDLFQRHDTENRKWLARSLRYIAHHNNSSLYFCSTKNMQVGAQLRAYLQQKIVDFEDKRTGNTTKKQNTKLNPQPEHTKPIFISNGEDSIRSMNLPSAGSMNTMDILKKQLNSLFSAQQQKKKEPIDLSKYGETRIDTIINEKKKQLERIAKMLQNSQNRSNRRL